MNEYKKISSFLGKFLEIFSEKFFFKKYPQNTTFPLLYFEKNSKWGA